MPYLRRTIPSFVFSTPPRRDSFSLTDYYRDTRLEHYGPYYRSSDSARDLMVKPAHTYSFKHCLLIRRVERNWSAWTGEPSFYMRISMCCFSLLDEFLVFIQIRCSPTFPKKMNLMKLLLKLWSWIMSPIMTALRFHMNAKRRKSRLDGCGYVVSFCMMTRPHFFLLQRLSLSLFRKCCGRRVEAVKSAGRHVHFDLSA